MASDALVKGALYDELRQLAPELIGEILAGNLYSQPRPANLNAASTRGHRP